MVSDEIRAVIWPILASSLIQDQEACPEDDLLSAPSVSDSDFESARSSFSDGEEDDPLTPTIESKVSDYFIFFF